MSSTETGPLWTALRRQDMDASTDLTLFDLSEVDPSMQVRKPDRYGTPDLFSTDRS